MLNVICIMVLGVVAFIKNNKNKKVYSETLSKKEIVLIIGGIIIYGFYIALYQVLWSKVDISFRGKILGIVIYGGGFGILGRIVVLVLRNHRLRYTEQMLTIQENLLREQQKYYADLLIRERETKKFRHDISQHLNVIYYLEQQGRRDELKKYIEELISGLEIIKRENVIDTGNDIVSVILAEQMSKYNDYNVNVTWNGLIPLDLKISLRDLCGLFSNILKNSFEGAYNCEDNRYVDIVARANEDSFYLCVKNSKKNECKLVKDEYLTTKADIKNHGYGYQIIKDIVYRYRGEIHHAVDENQFQVEITFLDM